MHEHYHFWGMHYTWWVLWIVFIFIVFGVIRPARIRRLKKDNPLEILKRRLASGEINIEEYDKLKEKLEQDFRKAK